MSCYSNTSIVYTYGIGVVLVYINRRRPKGFSKDVCYWRKRSQRGFITTSNVTEIKVKSEWWLEDKEKVNEGFEHLYVHFFFFFFGKSRTWINLSLDL